MPIPHCPRDYFDFDWAHPFSTRERPKGLTMPTLADLIALVQTLPVKSDKLTADTAISNDALAAVTDVTNTEQAKIDAATAAFTVAVGAAQTAADAAVAISEADKKDLDDTIDAAVAMALALKV